MKIKTQAIVIAYFSAFIAACSTPSQFSSYEGTYYMLGRKGNHITLGEYGIAKLSRVGKDAVEATYQIRDGVLDICGSRGCDTVGVVDGDIIVDREGIKWIKKSVECFDASSCAKKIKHRIQSNLLVEKSDIGLITKVNFKLDQDTNLYEFSIIEPSGSNNFDSEVESAVRASFPYEFLLSIDQKEYKKLQDINLSVAPE